jgi:predicted RNA-binding protein
MSEQFWILCGKPENWDIALKDEIWGLVPKFQGKWRHLQIGDYLFFYATNPIRGVIGIGRVQAKFKQNQPLWPDEIAIKSVLYPFRFEFETEYVLSHENRGTGKIKINLPIGFYSAMNLLDDEDIIDKLKEAVKQQWSRELVTRPETSNVIAKPAEEHLSIGKVELTHDKVKDMIFEIGKLHRYIVDKEYVINSDRLDVVWRRVEKSVPTYAFEVQIGGDIYHALGKLKHAYDIWNSNIYIVTSDEQRERIEELIGGTFHEIKNYLNIISLKNIDDLYSLQLKDVKLRKEIGLP